MKSAGIVGFLISFGIISYVLYTVGIGDIVAIFGQLSLFYAGIAILLYILNSVLNALRWNQFIVAMKMKIKFMLVYVLVWIGNGISSVTPPVIAGGEPAKVYLLSKFGSAKKSTTLATVVANGFLEGASFMLLDILAVLIIYVKFDLPVIVVYPLLFVIGLGILSVGSFVYAVLNQRASLAVTLFFTSILKKFRILRSHVLIFEENLEHHVDVFNSALKEISFRTLVSTMGISILMRVVDILRLYMITVAFGITMDPVFVLVAVAFATIAAMAPVLPGSIGAVEPAMIAGFMLGGLSLPVATAVVIVDRIIVLGLNTSLGFGCMYFCGCKGGLRSLGAGGGYGAI